MNKNKQDPFRTFKSWFGLKKSNYEKEKLPSCLLSPNPVSPGGSLNIKMEEIKKGGYALKLVNQPGQTVYGAEISADDASMLSLIIPRITRGNYFLELTHKKSHKKFIEKLIVR